MPLQKSVDLRDALGLEDGTSGVEQPPARRQQRPERIEQARLGLRQRVDVSGTAQPADIRVAPHDARRAARRVEQDRVERPAVPPARGVGRVGSDRLRLKAEARKGLVDAAQPVGVAVEREDVEVAELEQVRGLAAGRRAGVEDRARRVRRLAVSSGAASWAA